MHLQVDFKSLEKLIRRGFEEFGTPFIETDQDNQTVRQHAFQRPPKSGAKGRTFCYVLYEDRVHRDNPCNLVFRFRTNPEPATWFKRRSVSEYANNWANKRLIEQWSEASGTPKRLLEAKAATNQFGIALTNADIVRPELKETLRLFIEIAIESVTQAAKRKTADWSRYTQLIG